jgi:hypothetical protein
MARVRIVCKWPESPKAPTRMVDGYEVAGVSLVQYPSLYDTEVFIVRDDGVEERLEGVASVKWSVRLGSEALAEIVVASEADLAGEAFDVRGPTGPTEENPFHPPGANGPTAP